MEKKKKIVLIAAIMILCCLVLVACGTTKINRDEIRTEARQGRMKLQVETAFSALPYAESFEVDGDTIRIDVGCDVETFSVNDLHLPNATIHVYSDQYFSEYYAGPFELSFEEPLWCYVSLEMNGASFGYYLEVTKKHIYGDWTVLASPTCVEEGAQMHVCKICSLREEGVIEPLGHTYGDWTEVRPVTCLEESERTRTCQVCFYVDDEITPAPGHDLIHHEGKPNCLEEGWAPYDTCSRCDYNTYQALPIEGHKPVDDPETHATCTENGYTAGSHCSVCGLVFVERQVTEYAFGHSFGYWSDATATCTEDGERSRTCYICGYVETQVVDAYGHNFSGNSCTRCGQRLSTGLLYESRGSSYAVVGIGYCSDQDIYIPDNYNGYPVTEIGPYAFYGVSFVRSIILPKTITKIGENAFAGCDALVDLTIPQSTFGGDSFSNAFRYEVKYAISGAYRVESDQNVVYSSAATSDSRSSIFTITVNKAGAFAFEYRVSSESSFDYFTISYNSVQLDRISGETDYKRYVKANAAVGDVITFTYSKDSSASANNDRGYVRFANVPEIEGDLQRVALLDEGGKSSFVIYNGLLSVEDTDVYLGEVRYALTSEMIAVLRLADHIFYKGTNESWAALCAQYSDLQGLDKVYFYTDEHKPGKTWGYVNGAIAVGPVGAHSYQDGVCSICGAEEPIASYVRSGNYIYFGSYPQTKVTDSSLTNALTAQAGALPSSSNRQHWTSYNYYNSSNPADYAWYIDLTYGSDRYRGVYFVDYRSDSTTKTAGTGTLNQKTNGYQINNVYWFKYEPIKWRILSESADELLLLCENAIDAQQYYYAAYSGTQSRNGTNVYANNYAESDIRSWLNNVFFNTAFSAADKSAIRSKTVNNNARSANPENYPSGINYGTNYYASGSTTDAIFLLSVQEASNSAYGFSSTYDQNDTSRRKSSSDYAKAQGAWKDSSSSMGSWMLRSPNPNSETGIYCVTSSGYVSYNYTTPYVSSGIAPAIRIRP
ncbi:MAG: leucine-rich repeat domain-containing protein [Clostridia bacterium]|nr:leucine-rich repeat domain-containing protein [Clostridia bacterium]